MRKKAEMGIGTLIIFIAMILVAAIAAGVLIQTAGSLQNKALLTGKRSKTQVSTSLRPMLIYAEDGSKNNDVNYVYMKVKLAPGSDPIKVGDMLVELSLKNLTQDMNFNDSFDCDDESTLNNSKGFGLDYLITGDNWGDGYIQRGDVIKLCFNSTREMEEDESVGITLIPKVGNPTQINTALPDIITQKRVTIYP